ncbi:hypothetical protein HELRODRAFT_159290 [Helobdella robusta]|uniref:Uncharacterized protein n=1 Tax=Helobdella robusta TaxID=6412 RepID=T1ENU4_HELRO|nr:hypothetical protein HELRODRAFT_159290 [Helobdella robusta]ESO12704.1 hypothetical protein HELRODRAFT_159290 [Helobdella robusta]
MAVRFDNITLLSTISVVRRIYDVARRNTTTRHKLFCIVDAKQTPYYQRKLRQRPLHAITTHNNSLQMQAWKFITTATTTSRPTLMNMECKNKKSIEIKNICKNKHQNVINNPTSTCGRYKLESDTLKQISNQRHRTKKQRGETINSNNC